MQYITASAEDAENRFMGLVIHDEKKGAYEAACYSGAHYPANIIAISSQVGCPVQCSHCAAPNFQAQLSVPELVNQIELMRSQGEMMLRKGTPTKLSLTRLGDPALNPSMPDFFKELRSGNNVSVEIVQFFSILPNTAQTRKNLEQVFDIAEMNQRIQKRIQEILFYVSIHTTNQKIREAILVQNGSALMPFPEIREWIDEWFRRTGKKVVVNLARSEAYPVDPKTLAETFSADHVRVRVSGLRATEKTQSKGHIPEERAKGQSLLTALQGEGFEAYPAHPSGLETQYRTSVGELVRHMQPGMIPQRVGIQR